MVVSVTCGRADERNGDALVMDRTTLRGPSNLFSATVS